MFCVWSRSSSSPWVNRPRSLTVLEPTRNNTWQRLKTESFLVLFHKYLSLVPRCDLVLSEVGERRLTFLTFSSTRVGVSPFRLFLSLSLVFHTQVRQTFLSHHFLNSPTRALFAKSHTRIPLNSSDLFSWFTAQIYSFLVEKYVPPICAQQHQTKLRKKIQFTSFLCFLQRTP